MANIYYKENIKVLNKLMKTYKFLTTQFPLLAKEGIKAKLSLAMGGLPQLIANLRKYSFIHLDNDNSIKYPVFNEKHMYFRRCNISEFPSPGL
ncbi:MAG: hypothetical protein MAG551_02466 [Candidatus Scalindua arabica]|uniref:Uncharacterized protein n=1 Tax=Candidatus Scalindua arabica TaxID=1127984 RepID=A0A942A3S6_9BACT|nr:hypothetical protein [Candidatus Scalindua arabica]